MRIYNCIEKYGLPLKTVFFIGLNPDKSGLGTTLFEIQCREFATGLPRGPVNCEDCGKCNRSRFNSQYRISKSDRLCIYFL